jgi:hypothetical protein
MCHRIALIDERMLRVPDDEPNDAGLDAPEADAERIDDRRNRLPGLDGIT